MICISLFFQYTIETWKNNLQILKQQTLQNTKFMSLPKLLAITVSTKITSNHYPEIKNEYYKY